MTRRRHDKLKASASTTLFVFKACQIRKMRQTTEELAWTPGPGVANQLRTGWHAHRQAKATARVLDLQNNKDENNDAKVWPATEAMVQPGHLQGHVRHYAEPWKFGAQDGDKRGKPKSTMLVRRNKAYTLVAQGKTRVAVAAEVLLGLLCSYIAHAPHISQEAWASSSISTAVDCATAAMFVAQSSSSSVMQKSWGFVSLAADFIYHVTPTGGHLKDDSCRVPVGVKALALQHGVAASIVPGAYSRLQQMDIEVGGRSLPPLCCCFVLMFDRQ